MASSWGKEKYNGKQSTCRGDAGRPLREHANSTRTAPAIELNLVGRSCKTAVQPAGSLCCAFQLEEILLDTVGIIGCFSVGIHFIQANKINNVKRFNLPSMPHVNIHYSLPFTMLLAVNLMYSSHYRPCVNMR